MPPLASIRISAISLNAATGTSRIWYRLIES